MNATLARLHLWAFRPLALSWLLAIGAVRAGAGAPAEADPAFRAQVSDPVFLREMTGVGVDAQGRVTVAVLDFTPALPGPSLIRFLPEGGVDPGFKPQLQGSRVTSLLLLRSGRMLVAGLFKVSGGGVTRTNLAMLNPDGSLDLSFDLGPGWESPRPYGELPDGRLLLSGRYRGSDGVSRVGPHRVLADGRLDETFAPAKWWAELGVESVVPRENGSVYLIGMIRPRATNELTRIARTLPDGSVDDGFRYVGNWVYSAWVTSPEGGVYAVTSNLGSDLRTTVMDVVRLRPDGTPDPGFRVEVSGRNNVVGTVIQNPPTVSAMARQVDGRLLLAGKFDRVNGVVRRNIARLESDGSVDGTFDPGTGPALSTDGSNFGYPVAGMALARDGGIFLAGQFDRYAGRVHRVVVRLQGDPVPRLHIGRSLQAAEAFWIGHPGEIVEVEVSGDLEAWSAHHAFTHAGGVMALPRPTGPASFLRARWR